MGWENPVHLSQNPLIFSADHGITDTKSSFIMSGWPTQAANFRHHSQLFQAPSCVAENSLQSPPALRSYGSVVEALQNIMHTGHESGFPGISTARHEIANDLKSLEQRRRFLGLLDLEHPSTCRDRLKEDGVYGLQGADPYDRIGLNLGGRTYFSAEDLMRLGKRPHVHATAVHLPICQADGCTADLTRAKHYYRRHKVCEMHSKAAHVLANGQTQRFCQQCSRLHVVSEFDDAKRSCRKRLADHNRRRRKPQTTAALQSGPAKMESTALKSEESEQSAANCISEAKSLAMRSKEQESSSDLEEPGGNNNGMVAHSLEYETLSSDFFRADCSSSSNNAMLQLNQARTSPDSQPPSLKSTTNASTVMLPTSNYLQLPSPEIYRQNNVLEGSRQSTDPSLSLSHLGNRSSFEAQYQMLNSPSQSLFQESKTAAKWVNAANSYGGLTRSSIDFQQIMPVKHSHHGHLHDDAGFEHSYVRSKLPPNN